MPAPSPDPHEKIDWGSLEVQALVACEQYWTPDSLPKPTSLLFLIHAIGRQKAAAEAELRAIDAVLARRPALDKPTRVENIEHAINTVIRLTSRQP